jgi:protein involved in polysaccharide export with SLBB domain
METGRCSDHRGWADFGHMLTRHCAAAYAALNIGQGRSMSRGAMDSRRAAGTFVLFLALCLAGCDNTTSLGAASIEDQRALMQAASTTSPNLQPGEKIKVTVFGEDRLSGEYEIDPSGLVSLPLAGTVKAAGMSKPDFERELAKRFRGEYLRDPKVTVEVTSFRDFFILGEVTKPGEYPYKSGLTVVSAVAIAGGATYRASRSTVQIQHSGESGYKDYPLSPTIPILPGDTINVPQRYF